MLLEEALTGFRDSTAVITARSQEEMLRKVSKRPFVPPEAKAGHPGPVLFFIHHDLQAPGGVSVKVNWAFCFSHTLLQEAGSGTTRHHGPCVRSIQPWINAELWTALNCASYTAGSE